MKTVMKIIYLVWNVILYPGITSSDCGTYKQFILKTVDEKRLNATFHTTNKYGKNTCISHCVRNTACRSVNYSRKLLVCELNFVDDIDYPTFLKSDGDFQYYLIDKANSTSKSISQTPQCLNEYQECVITHMGERTCLPFHDFKEASSVNVALGKTVYSSTGYGLITTAPKPWFLVDLGQAYEITEITTYRIHTSATCVNFDVRIGITTNVSEMVFCNYGSQVHDVTIDCTRCLVGQFIQLQINAYDNTNCHFHLLGLITVEAQYYNRYYSYYRYTSNSTSASTTSTQNYNTLLYIGAIVGVLVCVVAIVIIVVTCMCCRRKQRTAGTVIHSTSNPTNVVFSTSQVPSHSSSEALNSQQQFHQRTGISPPPYHNDSLPPPYSDGNLSSSPYTNEPLPPLYSKDPPQEILNRTTPSAPSLHDLDK